MEQHMNQKNAEKSLGRMNWMSVSECWFDMTLFV